MSDQVSTVCKKLSHFSLRICKSHSWIYLKLKLDSSNIKCGRVYSIYNGLSMAVALLKICKRIVNTKADGNQSTESADGVIVCELWIV